jgi:hypothetical protein
VCGVIGAGVDGPNIPAGAGVPCECICESPMAALDPRFGAGDIRACCSTNRFELVTL